MDKGDKAEKLRGELKSKAELVIEWILIIAYLILVIHFVFKPLTEFMSLIEYNIKLGIIKYFFK